MGQDRLDDLAIKSIEQDILWASNADNVIDLFGQL